MFFFFFFFFVVFFFFFFCLLFFFLSGFKKSNLKLNFVFLATGIDIRDGNSCHVSVSCRVRAGLFC